MEIIKETIKWGNSAGVLLPKGWLGSQVKIILIERSLEIKKEVLRILDNYLEDILGIYLTGSYARNEQTKKSDIDIIAITNRTRKEIISGKYHISLATLDGIKETLDKNPELILPRIIEAKVIINSNLLEELRSWKVDKDSFKRFISDTRETIKINKEMLKLDREMNRDASGSVVYSIILRLRSVFLINCLLKKKDYKKRDFLKWIKEGIEEDISDAYEIYESVRDEKKAKIKITLEKAKKLIKFLKTKINDK